MDDINTVFFLFELPGKDYYYSKVSWQVSIMLTLDYIYAYSGYFRAR